MLASFYVGSFARFPPPSFVNSCLDHLAHAHVAYSTAEFTQLKRLGVPNFATEAPVEVPVQGAFQLRWHCRCVLPWCNESFPQTRNGQAAVLFANKKVP